MSTVRNLVRKFSEYIVFIAGLLFIFVLGLIYSFIEPESLIIKAVFVLIVIGWTAFLIKYFWDLIEKGRKKEEENDFESDIEDQMKASSKMDDKNKEMIEDQKVVGE